MKKKSALLLGAMVSVASLGIAAPANAQDCTTLETMPGTSTVSVDNGQLRLNPNGPTQDVANFSDYLNDLSAHLVSCGFSLVPPTAWCAYDEFFSEPFNQIWLGKPIKYVYEDPYTGEVVVDYGQVQDDLNSCL